MVNTRDLFNKIRDAKGKLHAKMGTIKERQKKKMNIHSCLYVCITESLCRTPIINTPV